jgi:hypothetical protein
MQTAAIYIGDIIGIAILIGAMAWVFLDAKAIGDDHGRSPGLVNTKPGAWAVGIFMMLIVVLPIYLVARVRYKHLLAVRRVSVANVAEEVMEGAAEEKGTWPPPPTRPVA